MMSAKAVYLHQANSFIPLGKTFRECSIIDISYEIALQEWGISMIPQVRSLREQVRTFRECSIIDISYEIALREWGISMIPRVRSLRA